MPLVKWLISNIILTTACPIGDQLQGFKNPATWEAGVAFGATLFASGGQVDETFQTHVKSGKLQLKFTNPTTGAKAHQNTKSGYSYNLDPGRLYGKKIELPTY